MSTIIVEQTPTTADSSISKLIKFRVWPGGGVVARISDSGTLEGNTNDIANYDKNIESQGQFYSDYSYLSSSLIV